MAVFILEMIMCKVALIGNGNVASHLINSLTAECDGFDYVGSYSRSSGGPLPQADIYIVAVSDDAISDATALLPLEALVLHTSGTKSIDEINNRIEHRGVLYPLQTFTKGIAVNMKEVPFFIESHCPVDVTIIEKLALTLGRSVTYTDSRRRKTIHIAAVFSCNFTNHLYAIAQDILRDDALDFTLLEPLIKESIRKVMTAENIHDIQTGPAVRRDYKTIMEHEKMLSVKDTNLEKIYSDITKSIINNGKF